MSSCAGRSRAEQARKFAVEDLSEYGSLIEAIEHLPEANEQGHPIYPPDY